MPNVNALRQIAKKIFPAVLLKQAFLIYNKFRISTFDKILFPEHRIQAEEFLLYRKGYPFRETGISLDAMKEGRIKQYMQDWNDWTQEEFILLFETPCVIEPNYGWAVVGRSRLVYYSLGVSRTWFQPKPKYVALRRQKAATLVDNCISLRDSGEENYFHFFNDVLGKLYFLKSNKVTIEGTPLIVSKRLAEKPFFRYALENNLWLKSLNWFYQGDNYIKCRRAIFCKPLTHRMDLWSQVIAPFRIPHSDLNITKVFLTRSKSRLRFIENIEEVEQVCRKLGFSTVDADMLSPRGQIELFCGVRFLIGIHGAGLTNLAFANRPGSLLEIFPPASEGYLPYHYIMLAKMFGWSYNAMIGKASASAFSGGFYVDAAELEEKVSETAIELS
jgi:hypothetical protein